MSKPRVLCLHGRGLNSAYFRGQLLGLIRRNPQLDFFFLEGHLPAEVAPEALGAWKLALKPPQRRAWQYFTLCRDEGADPAHRWRAGHDVAQGLEHVWEAAWEETQKAGGFFAALGFSQGANVAAALIAKQACSARSLGLRCSVNLCGGIWGFWGDGTCEVTRQTPRLPLRGFPSLHIIGLGDPYLAQSKYLLEGLVRSRPHPHTSHSFNSSSYADADGCERRVLEHDGGHTPFPLVRGKREEVLEEISGFLRRYAEPK
ncbi:Esterase FUS5 (Fusarin biosynthesis protein 5) [Durusdinium trenchii]|uniref:Esterase FUS5 (Fusarin biosynthesis protein 5) n=1 Tax=Durusdinium trenchii TaxID=1381693 RepID=A0ABP0MKG5_9DINO